VPPQASPGGYVMDSRPGLYDSVLVLDYKSLYPSIIRTFLIDPVGLIEGMAQPDNAHSTEGFSAPVSRVRTTVCRGLSGKSGTAAMMPNGTRTNPCLRR
jgi:DNA polymerase elongation subunit (family B)